MKTSTMDASNKPIIIYIGMLEKWLINRGDVNEDWQKNITAIRDKINNAIQDMPANDRIGVLLSDNSINYFDCLKILEILNETEAHTKNSLGKYESQKVKEWHEIVRCYEKDNIYLAEAAHTLVTNIISELPSLKEQIPVEEEREVILNKKHEEYLSKEQLCKSEFLDLCKQLGIKGDKIKRELVERLQELPDIYDKIEKSLKHIQPCIEFYYDFNKYVLREQAVERLSLLKYVVEHGNTTVYEWTYGELPLSVEPDPIHFDLDDEQGSGDGIKIGSKENAIESEKINCNDDNIETQSTDIALSVDGVAMFLEGAAVQQSVPPGVARGQDALRLLDYTHTRDLIVNQLIELESFLAMRIYDINTESEKYVFHLEEKPPETESDEVLDAMLATVKSVSNALLNPEITHLHKVKNSPGYLVELTAYVQKKLDRCNKLSQLRAREADRLRASRERVALLQEEHQRLLRRTEELQGQWANEISQKNMGRPVKIIDGLKIS